MLAWTTFFIIEIDIRNIYLRGKNFTKTASGAKSQSVNHVACNATLALVMDIFSSALQFIAFCLQHLQTLKQSCGLQTVTKCLCLYIITTFSGIDINFLLLSVIDC